MADPVLYPELWQDCSSDVSAEIWLATPWSQVNSDVNDWLDRTIWSKVSGQLLARGMPVQREIFVLGSDTAAIPERGNLVNYHVWANTVSDSDGSFELQWSVITSYSIHYTKLYEKNRLMH